jgi:hypothetical protein
MTQKKEKQDEKVVVLAEKIKILFGFVHGMAPDLELLRKSYIGARNSESFAVSTAPILGALGVDFQHKEFEWKLRKERAQALINLIEVLERTEKERTEMNKRKAGMDEIVKLFGL